MNSTATANPFFYKILEVKTIFFKSGSARVPFENLERLKFPKARKDIRILRQKVNLLFLFLWFKAEVSCSTWGCRTESCEVVSVYQHHLMMCINTSEHLSWMTRLSRWLNLDISSISSRISASIFFFVCTIATWLTYTSNGQQSYTFPSHTVVRYTATLWSCSTTQYDDHATKRT